jgi:hypothetical protein
VQTPSQPLVQVQANVNPIQVQTPSQPLVQVQANVNPIQVQTPSQPLVQANVNPIQVQTPSQPLVQPNVNQLQAQNHNLASHSSKENNKITCFYNYIASIYHNNVCVLLFVFFRRP